MPTATEYSGMSSFTTAAPPIIEFLPMVTPSNIALLPEPAIFAHYIPLQMASISVASLSAES